MAAGDNYFECTDDKSLTLDQALRLMIKDDGSGNPVWSLNADGSALDNWFNCEERKNMTLEQVIRLMIIQDANGNPKWNTTEL